MPPLSIVSGKPKQARAIRLSLYLLTTLLLWGSIYAYVPILPHYAEGLGANKQMLGLITGVYGGMQMLRLVLGPLSDRLKKQKLFVTLGLGLATFGAILLLFSQSPWGIVIGRAFAGMAACSFVQQTVLYKACHQGPSSTAMGQINAYANLGDVIAMLVGGWLALRFGASAAFILAIVLGAAGFILSFWLFEEPVARVPVGFKAIIRMIANPKMILASLLALLAQAVMFAKVFTFALVSAREAQASTLALSWVTSISMLGSFVASMAFSIAALRKAPRKLMFIIGFCLQFLAILMMILWPSVFCIMVSQGLSGLSYGLTFTLCLALCVEDIEKNRQTTAMACFQSLYALGMFIGPTVAGFLVERSGSLNAAYWFCLAICGICIVTSFCAVPKNQEPT